MEETRTKSHAERVIEQKLFSIKAINESLSKVDEKISEVIHAKEHATSIDQVMMPALSPGGSQTKYIFNVTPEIRTTILEMLHLHLISEREELFSKAEKLMK